MVTRAELEPDIKREWLKRPEEKRTEGDVYLFYCFLEQNRPDLLSFRTTGDQYQVLHSILKNHIQK